MREHGQYSQSLHVATGRLLLKCLIRSRLETLSTECNSGSIRVFNQTSMPRNILKKCLRRRHHRSFACLEGPRFEENKETSRIPSGRHRMKNTKNIELLSSQLMKLEAAGTCFRCLLMRSVNSDILRKHLKIHTEQAQPSRGKPVKRKINLSHGKDSCWMSGKLFGQLLSRLRLLKMEKLCRPGKSKHNKMK